jgi:hypothetical protein
MPVHDWTRVEAGIFHDFHHAWIEEIRRALNAGILPNDYYAMAEQHAAGFGPDVLTLQTDEEEIASPSAGVSSTGNGGLLVAPPLAQPVAETDMEYYRRKQSSVVVRHVSGDRVVAMVEVVSPGNKSSRHGIRSFVEKAADLLDQRIHLVILDVHPPGPRDPNGMHGEIWEEISGEEYQLDSKKPLTVASYESALTVRAYVEHVAVGDVLPDVPLFLEPNGQVPLPLERTYQAAWDVFPRRWRGVDAGP